MRPLTAGYNIVDLANQSTFEEVLYLLLYERLPTLEELEEFFQRLHQSRWLPVYLKDTLERIPKDTVPMV